MFSQFKKIVNSSLEELERLGDSSFQQQQQQQAQQHAQLFPSSALSQHGRGYSESSVPTASSLGTASSSDFPSTGIGRRSPNNLLGPAMPGGGGRGGYAAYQRPTSAVSQPAVAGPSSPLAMSGSVSGSHTGISKETSEGFPGLGGFSGIKRSLSHLPRSSLDLSSLRNSLDASSTSPMTPSREGRELPDWSSPANRPTTPGGGRLKRRSSARAASISGPFTPDTMTKMDPFFFASLQGLPDELKIAAFTPLPKEDADEELDQIDQEFNPPAKQFNSLPINLPQIITSNLTKSVPPSFRPSSAPAAGPAQSFGQNQLQMAKSPLVEQTRISLLEQALHNHEEVDEEEHEDHTSSVFSHTPEMASTVSASGNGDEGVETQTAPSDIAEASPAPVFDDLPDVSHEAKEPVADEAEIRPVPYGRLSASSTPRRGRSPARAERDRSPAPAVEVVPEVIIEGATDALQALPDASAGTREARSSSPAPSVVSAAPNTASPPSKASAAAAKAHEPLAARLARISRAASPLHASTSAIDEANKPSQSSAARTVDKATGEAAAKRNVDQAALEALLRRYIPLQNGVDLAALEQFLQAKATPVAAPPDTTALRKAEEAGKRLQERVSSLEAEVKEARAATTRAETKTKEEEEKKAKSITLLKAVRQKLIKAEKDKEEAEILREAAKVSEENLSAETRQLRQRFEQETMGLRTSNEQQLARLRASYEREAQSIRATFDREAAARRGQTELEIVNMRSAHSRDLAERGSRIATLEGQLRDLRREKDSLFSSLQQKAAEVEAATEKAERVQIAHDELQYATRDAEDRVSALQEEIGSFKKARLDAARDDGHTRRLLADLESTNADRIAGFEMRIKQLEKERGEAEDAMAAKLQEKLRELDRMRRDIERRDAENSEETQRREERQQRMDRAENLNRSLQEKVAALDMLLNEAKLDHAKTKEEEATIKELLADQTRRNNDLEARLEELANKEAILRSSNKTLREELRKVQAGILLSERSRNPGVGYFSSHNASQSSLAGTPAAERDGALFSPPLSGRQAGPPARVTNGDEKETHNPPSASSAAGRTSTSSARAETSEEALNFEYIRNVILQFLEHKEMRPHLVSVLGVILQFTPAETRRLSAKAMA